MHYTHFLKQAAKVYLCIIYIQFPFLLIIEQISCYFGKRNNSVIQLNIIFIYIQTKLVQLCSKYTQICMEAHSLNATVCMECFFQGTKYSKKKTRTLYLTITLRNFDT